ncbi:hypothetical protein BGZ80_006609, partial [Entomortierella chlamydospora]
MKIAVILSTLVAATLVSAGKFHPVKFSDVEVVPNAFIIEYHDGVKHNQAQNSLKASKVDFKVRNEYNIFNGAAFTIKSDHSGEALAKVSGIKNVWHVTVQRIPKVQKSKKKPTDPEVTSLHHMTGVDVVHSKLKLTGKGVKIGIIDT